MQRAVPDIRLGRVRSRSYLDVRAGLEPDTVTHIIEIECIFSMETV
jgi:hypothetical protein